MLTDRDRQVLRHIEDHKAITIKQAQKLFFKNYESARRRLKQLENMGLLHSYENKISDEKVYYSEKKISSHDLLVLDFYAELVFQGAAIRQFRKQPKFLNDLIRGDAFIEFLYENNLYYIILEVDLTHFTSSSKMQLYEKLYKEGTLQKECRGVFPSVVIMKNHSDIRYLSNNFEVIYLDFKLFDFNSKIF